MPPHFIFLACAAADGPMQFGVGDVAAVPVQQCSQPGAIRRSSISGLRRKRSNMDPPALGPCTIGSSHGVRAGFSSSRVANRGPHRVLCAYFRGRLARLHATRSQSITSSIRSGTGAGVGLAGVRQPDRFCLRARLSKCRKIRGSRSEPRPFHPGTHLSTSKILLARFSWRSRK